MKERKIAVMGPEEFTLGFELVGVESVFNPDNPESRTEKLLESEKFGIVITSEEFVEELDPLLADQVSESVDPVFVMLTEEADHGDLNQKIKQAIGADIST